MNVEVALDKKISLSPLSNKGKYKSCDILFDGKKENIKIDEYHEGFSFLKFFKVYQCYNDELFSSLYELAEKIDLKFQDTDYFKFCKKDKNKNYIKVSFNNFTRFIDENNKEIDNIKFQNGLRIKGLGRFVMYEHSHGKSISFKLLCAKLIEPEDEKNNYYDSLMRDAGII